MPLSLVLCCGDGAALKPNEWKRIGLSDLEVEYNEQMFLLICKLSIAYVYV